MKIRISLVHYLNSAPLGWSFLHGPLRDRFEVIQATPAQCADQLAAGDVDAGLIPSIEYQKVRGLRIVPGIAIAADSAVRSVVMVRPRGRRIRSVALDDSSRTSVVLLKLLLCRRLGLTVDFVPHPPDVSAMLESCDAALVIGDAALKLPRDSYDIMDLAEAWIEWQKMPFVFAFWAFRADRGMNGDIVSLFHEAKSWGLASRPAIAGHFAAQLGLPEAFLLEYLSRNITYELGAEHIMGLRAFYALAHEAGLIGELDAVRFFPTP